MTNSVHGALTLGCRPTQIEPCEIVQADPVAASSEVSY